MPTPDADLLVALRPLRSEDVTWLADMITDRAAIGPHNWGGPVDRAEVVARLTQQVDDGPEVTVERGRLVVEVGPEDGDATPIGHVSWRGVHWGPSPESVCPSIGIALLPEWRRRGFGRTAQRLLADTLFDLFPIHRVQADTAVDNPAERKALEAAGFTCEGLIRRAEVRDGRVYDHLLYSRLRGE